MRDRQDSKLEGLLVSGTSAESWVAQTIFASEYCSGSSVGGSWGGCRLVKGWVSWSVVRSLQLWQARSFGRVGWMAIFGVRLACKNSCC